MYPMEIITVVNENVTQEEAHSNSIYNNNALGNSLSLQKPEITT